MRQYPQQRYEARPIDYSDAPNLAVHGFVSDLQRGMVLTQTCLCWKYSSPIRDHLLVVHHHSRGSQRKRSGFPSTRSRYKSGACHRGAVTARGSGCDPTQTWSLYEHVAKATKRIHLNRNEGGHCHHERQSRCPCHRPRWNRPQIFTSPVPSSPSIPRMRRPAACSGDSRKFKYFHGIQCDRVNDSGLE